VYHIEQASFAGAKTEVFSLDGRLLMDTQLQGQTLDLSPLPTGTYLIRLHHPQTGVSSDLRVIKQ
jgi:hypothetical protein